MTEGNPSLSWRAAIRLGVASVADSLVLLARHWRRLLAALPFSLLIVAGDIVLMLWAGNVGASERTIDALSDISIVLLAVPLEALFLMLMLPVIDRRPGPRNGAGIRKRLGRVLLTTATLLPMHAIHSLVIGGTIFAIALFHPDLLLAPVGWGRVPLFAILIVAVTVAGALGMRLLPLCMEAARGRWLGFRGAWRAHAGKAKAVVVAAAVMSLIQLLGATGLNELRPTGDAQVVANIAILYLLTLSTLLSVALMVSASWFLAEVPSSRTVDAANLTDPTACRTDG